MATALGALQAGSQAFASFFLHPGWCAGVCPRSTAELRDMLRGGRCNASSHLHGGAENLPDLIPDLASKVIGVPARMTTVRIHTATPSIGSPHPYAACLQHPVPVIERDPQGCHANQSQQSRALRRRRSR